MGMRDEITEALIEAFNDPDGLQDAVTEFVGSRQVGGGTYDPVNDVTIPAPPLLYQGRGVFGGYEVQMVDGIRILSTDTKLLALQAEVTAAPIVDDVINGMTVISIGRDPAHATWSVQLREV